MSRISGILRIQEVITAGNNGAARCSAYCAYNWLDELTPQQVAQSQLPLALGGFGLRSTYSLREAAWIGSWALCLPAVHTLTMA